MHNHDELNSLTNELSCILLLDYKFELPENDITQYLQDWKPVQ